MAVLKKRHLDMIKNIFYLVLMLAFSWKGLGQTYTIKINYEIPYEGCNGIEFESYYGAKQEGKYIGISRGGSSQAPYIFVDIINNLPLISEIRLDVSTANDCDLTGIPRECYVVIPAIVRNISEIIKGDFIGAGGCGASTSIIYFQPNDMFIRNQKSATVCSGEELNLQGFPADFPNEAYHWQYSFDGVTNWIDVSNKINVRELNNTPTTRFSIYEILGKEHEKYFDKPIYFRLGYGQDRPFTEPLAITYSSCAPVAEEVVYVPPTCNGDAVNSIEVYFDRKLDPNENLSPIYVANKIDKTQQFFQPENPVKSLVFDPIKQRYKYSFTNLATLVEGDSYVVVYQARIGEVPRGVLTTSSKGFTYNDPAKLEFVITKQTPPSCFGGEDGSIEIMVTSGVSPYRFYLDRVELKNESYPKLIDGKYHILGLKANAEGYKIIVTDDNGCIEKPTP
jgi:hypothetical protein